MMPVEVRAACPPWLRFSARTLLAPLALCLALLAGTAGEADCASVVAFSHNDGYSGHVMDKVLSVWSPPAVGDERQLRLCVSLDGEGRVIECKPVRLSGLPALDASGCAAVREAAPFGTPPYGMPLDVYFSFWTGQPKGKAQAAPQAVAQAQSGADSGSRAAALAQEAAAGTQPSQRADTSSAQTSSGSSWKAQDKYDARYQKYLNQVVWKLRNAMYIPAETRPGTYYATAQVRCNSAGKILDASLLKSSGDTRLDKYVLQGIRRAGSVAPPPAGLGDTLDLTFTLTRQ